jgi:hypothetical protein
MPAPMVRRVFIQGLLALGVLALGGMPGATRAQSVELVTLQTSKAEGGGLDLDFVARVNLPAAVEQALQRGVPVYFVAEATLLRNRWYWRDERVARVSRSWRLALQPLTGAWRVSLGGLSQSYPSLAEALAAVSRGGWRLAEASRIEAGESYYVEFGYRLDTSQLPGPMQFGLGGQSDWSVGATRTFRVE